MALITILAPMKMLKIILLSLSTIVLLGAVSLVIDYYFYSWTSYLRPFGCKYKNIATSESGGNLENSFDLIQIGQMLSSNPNYSLGHPRLQKPYSSEQLEVTRRFGDVLYKIIFQNTQSGAKVRFNIVSTYVNQPSASAFGEAPSVPDHYIKVNIHQMINEMPLNDVQKEELKRSVTVKCNMDIRIDIL